jgi:hypothetical protein
MTISHNDPCDAANQRRATAWAKAAIESELGGLAGTSAHRNEALNKAAFAIGQLVGGGLIEHGAAHDRLVETAQGIGLMMPDEQKKTLSTIEHALSAGMKNPRHGPEGSGWRGSGANEPANSATEERGGAGTREFAKRRWDAARPADSDTPVVAYLRSRGIASPPPSSVRFHPETPMLGGSHRILPCRKWRRNCYAHLHFIVVPLRLVRGRSHRESARRHDHHLRASRTVPEAVLGLETAAL